MTHERQIAYFSMEIGMESRLPTYSGGLGVLAGDTIRSAADLGVPMVAVCLLYRKGYFRQSIDSHGWQQEGPVEWDPEEFVTEMPERVCVRIENREVHIRAWRYDVRGLWGHVIPIYFLDTDLPENQDWDKTLTHSLYGGDPHYRLCQEVVLGMGGVKILRALGYAGLARFHMNEGHAALLGLALLDERTRAAHKAQFDMADIEEVRKLCVFTTHTPVPAGHDQFPQELVNQVLGRPEIYEMRDILCCNGLLNMTHLALRLSGYVNGVAKKHQEVSQLMFANYEIDAITNGVHAGKWTAPSFRELFDRAIPGWQADNVSLRYATSLSNADIWNAHQAAKTRLLEAVKRQTHVELDHEALTIGFARRASTYKRGDLIFRDIERLKSIAQKTGPLQFVFAGKSHPRDNGGKELIQRIFRARETLRDAIKLVYLENYDMDAGALITAGVDVWLNTPQPPLEASGTSGMKAALNGVPSFSVLDGWWVEGCVEGKTGWAIGAPHAKGSDKDTSAEDASSFYEKLEKTVLPLFHKDRDGFIDVMRYAIALNGSFFNTQRMVQEYTVKAYAQM